MVGGLIDVSTGHGESHTCEEIEGAFALPFLWSDCFIYHPHRHTHTYTPTHTLSLSLTNTNTHTQIKSDVSRLRHCNTVELP
jgi:hypothetical protein